MPGDQGFRPEVGSRGLDAVASLKGERVVERLAWKPHRRPTGDTLPEMKNGFGLVCGA